MYLAAVLLLSFYCVTHLYGRGSIDQDLHQPALSAANGCHARLYACPAAQQCGVHCSYCAFMARPMLQFDLMDGAIKFWIRVRHHAPAQVN